MDNNKILTFVPKIYFPGAIFFGAKGPVFLKSIEAEKKLVVTTNGFKEKNEVLVSGLFAGPVEFFYQDREPFADDFDKLKELCQAGNFNWLVALGGGAAIDLAKLVKVRQGIKMAAIPTTVGSGAEVSQHAVIVENGAKKVYSSQSLLPEAVIYNHIFLQSLDKEQIVFQSIDALSHALESLVSRMANPLSDSFALLAIQKIYYYLDNFSNFKNQDEILENLQIAAFFAGLAQSSAATGLAHSFAHYFGPNCKISHAQAVAVFLLDVLELNSQKTDKYKKLDQLNDLTSKDSISKLKILFQDLKISLPKLKDTGKSLEDIAWAVKKDICTATNPYSPNTAELVEIIKKHLQ